MEALRSLAGGGLRSPSVGAASKRTDDMINYIQQYALQHGRLHSRVRDFLAPYFPTIDLRDVRVNAKLGRISAKSTSIWVLGKTVFVMRGKLNLKRQEWTSIRDGKLWHHNNEAIDLATVYGMRTLAHEVYHCQSWLTRPWWASVTEFAGDVWRSLRGTRFRSAWSHKHSRYEQAAIQAVDKGPIGDAIKARASELLTFEGLR